MYNNVIKRRTCWRYLHRGSAKHLIFNDNPAAWCGAKPVMGQRWHGDASPAERLKLARLTKCAKCRIAEDP